MHANTLVASVDWSVAWLKHLPKFCHTLTLQNHENKHTGLLANQLNQLAALPDSVLYQHQNTNAKPIHFIPQSELAENTAYESHIFNTGGIPSRDNVHDLFNACVWLTFPHSKTWLNATQAAQIEKHGISQQRGKLRDALTLFDENGAVLVTSDTGIAQALENFDWQHALVKPRNNWNVPYENSSTASAAVYLFGHAIMEQLLTPRKPICAHTLTLHVSADWFAQPLAAKTQYIDQKLKHLLQHAPDLHTKTFQPLPILGVPHFWAENAHPSFYDDTFVFRAGRRG